MLVSDLLPGVTTVVRRRALGRAVCASCYPRDLADTVLELADTVLESVEPAPLPDPDELLLTHTGVTPAPDRAEVERMSTRAEAAALRSPR